MTDLGASDRSGPNGSRPLDAEIGTGETSAETGARPSASRWQPDRYERPALHRPVAARRVRRGCWLLVVVLLLICCVLSAWLTDSILDLRAITTGG